MMGDIQTAGYSALAFPWSWMLGMAFAAAAAAAAVVHCRNKVVESRIVVEVGAVGLEVVILLNKQEDHPRITGTVLE